MEQDMSTVISNISSFDKQLAIRYTLHQNGVGERENETLVEM